MAVMTVRAVVLIESTSTLSSSSSILEIGCVKSRFSHYLIISMSKFLRDDLYRSVSNVVLKYTYPQSFVNLFVSVQCVTEPSKAPSA